MSLAPERPTRASQHHPDSDGAYRRRHRDSARSAFRWHPSQRDGKHPGSYAAIREPSEAFTTHLGARLRSCLNRTGVVRLKVMGLQNIKYIVPAVRNPRAKSMSNAFTRHAPRLNYAKANQRWWIHIDCDSDIDLYIFEKTLKGSETRIIELEDKFYVEDPRIPDAAHMGQAYRIAETILAQLNGATRILCPPFHGARMESIVELLDNGTGRGIVSCVAPVHGANDYPTIDAFLAGRAAPINSILPTLKSNKAVQEALYYLGAEGNVWANLYKASEVVEDHAGGGKAVFEKGFCSRSAWERFRRTANHQEAIGRFSRHARSHAEPPPDPMTDVEARRFVGELVKKWIQSVATEQQTPEATTPHTEAGTERSAM